MRYTWQLVGDRAQTPKDEQAMRQTNPALTPLTALLATCLVAGISCNKPTKSAQPQATPSGEFAPNVIFDRSAVPDTHKWNPSAILADDDAFERGLQEATTLRTELGGCRGTLADQVRLESCLELYFRTRLVTNKLTLYADMRLVTAVASAEYQAMSDRAQAAMHELMAMASFFRQEILAMDEATLAAAYESQPGLVTYRPYIEGIRRRSQHVLGPDGERVLTLAGDNLWVEIDLNEIPSDFERSFNATLADLPYPEIKDEHGKSVRLTSSSYVKYRSSPDRRVRRDAVEGFFGTLRQFEHIFATLLGGQARFTVFLARARGYDTALEAYLRKDEIDPVIYTNLVTSIESNLAPLHRYISLRKRLMDVDELHVYDLYTPIVPAVPFIVSYEQATRILPEALAPLGDHYVEVLREGLDPKNGWIDVYPHKGKAGGAFSASVYGVHPYVMMNFFNGFDDLTTLAHEYGHALHSHLMVENQPYVTASYPPLLAETASTFNEVLLSRYLIAHAETDAEKLYLLGELVERLRATVYRQSLFSSFELTLHTAVEQGTPITAKFMNDTYRALLRKYYGPDFTLGPNDDIEWAYVHHLYYKYYVYSYAAGMCAGTALADLVLSGEPEARDAYLGMLMAGSSKPPIELLRDAGVDVRDPAVFAASARMMDEALTEMEAILDRQAR